MDKFLQVVESINGEINGVVWGTFGLLLLVGTGIIITVLTKFFQVSHIGLWFKHTLGSLDLLFSRFGNGLVAFGMLLSRNHIKVGSATHDTFRAVLLKEGNDKAGSRKSGKIEHRESPFESVTQAW